MKIKPGVTPAQAAIIARVSAITTDDVNGITGANTLSTTYPALTKKDITADNIASFAGTSGTAPSATNKLVDAADSATNAKNGLATAAQITELERVGAAITTDVAAGLAGTSGTAISAANKLVDNADTRLATSVIVKGANQAAVTYTAIASAQSKIFVDYMPIVTCEAGAHAASVFSLDKIYSPITFLGDTRPLAGHTWKNGYPIHSTADGAGVGTTTISSSGNVVTLEGSTTDPKLNNAGNIWANSDKVVIAYNGGTQAEYTIDSVNAAGNEITLTGAAPAVTDAGTTLTLVPNRSISEVLAISDGDVTLQGFYMSGLAGSSITVDSPRAKLHLENCAIFNAATGITVSDDGYLSCGKEVAVVKVSVASIDFQSGRGKIDYIVCVGGPNSDEYYPGKAGILAQNARIEAKYCYLAYHFRGALIKQGAFCNFSGGYSVRQYNSGYRAYAGGTILISGSTVKNNVWGAVSSTPSCIVAIGCTYASNSSGNTTGDTIITS